MKNGERRTGFRVRLDETKRSSLCIQYSLLSFTASRDNKDDIYNEKAKATIGFVANARKQDVIYGKYRCRVNLLTNLYVQTNETNF